MSEALRLMAVHAHPDDESSKGAATLAKYVAAGREVMVVTCTGGERGDVLNPAVDLAGRDLADVRRDEMAAAVQILGVDHRWLGFEDSGFPDPDQNDPLPPGSFAEIPMAEAVAPLVALVREFKPHVMVTYDEHGGYPHPDHIRCHEISAEAFDAAADPSLFTEEGAPWAPLKLYYDVTFHKARMRALHDAVTATGAESPFADWLDNWGDRPEKSDRVTTAVECCDYFHVRDDALKAHATQVDPTGRWFTISREMQTEVWPTEDFELAAARVTPHLPETDLFAGLEPGMSPGPLVWRAARRSQLPSHSEESQ